tara:strand:- start:122 stop:433 length:312 start_codon:yes stop_codon:yes gene_type:complete
MEMKFNYKKLAQNIFNPQLIVDLDDADRVIEVCRSLIASAGYPLPENDDYSDDDEWLEFVYEAQDMCEISQKGFAYKRERNEEKRGGWEYVLYTRENHPAFQY